MAQRALGWPAARPLATFVGFAALALLVYRPALHGPFVSDDIGSPVALRHRLLHAPERQIFADVTLGYHLSNACAHAATAAGRLREELEAPDALIPAGAAREEADHRSSGP